MNGTTRCWWRASRTTLNEGDYQWPDALLFVVYGINSTVHQALACSPFEANSGRGSLQWLDAIGRPHALDDHGIDDGQAMRVQGTDGAADMKLPSTSGRLAFFFKKGRRIMVRSAMLQSKS